MPISADTIKKIIKDNHIFNNIILTSRPRVIKVFLKSDIVIIQLDIWDVQDRTKAKGIINCCFNVGSHIATIQRANMNPEIPQYKNYQKQRHLTSACRIQEAKYVKCNSLHKSEHPHHFSWCYKANNKTNSCRLKTKEDKPCPYFFKCLDCKEDYQADSDICLFWRHCSNREWYFKEYQKLCESRRQSICLAMNSNFS